MKSNADIIAGVVKELPSGFVDWTLGRMIILGYQQGYKDAKSLSKYYGNRKMEESCK